MPTRRPPATNCSSLRFSREAVHAHTHATPLWRNDATPREPNEQSGWGGGRDESRESARGGTQKHATARRVIGARLILTSHRHRVGSWLVHVHVARSPPRGVETRAVRWQRHHGPRGSRHAGEGGGGGAGGCPVVFPLGRVLGDLSR